MGEGTLFQICYEGDLTVEVSDALRSSVRSRTRPELAGAPRGAARGVGAGPCLRRLVGADAS
jgi:hypothetical protein